MRALMAAMVAAQVADFATFIPMVNRFGIGAEAMPTVVLVYTTMGLAGILAAKAALVTLLGGTALALRLTDVRLVGALLLMVGLLAGLLGAATNITTIGTWQS